MKNPRNARRLRHHGHDALRGDATPPAPPSWLLLAMEARAVFEWASYAMSWPLHGRAPSGDGHPVMVLPGLIATDRSTWPLRTFLERRGYTVYPWALGMNRGPVGDVVRRLTDRVREIEEKHERKLSLIGWSLGGAMAHALGLSMPERIRQVITLGSPLRGHPRATNAWRVFEAVSGMSADDPRLHGLLRADPKVPTTAILSRTDGVVNWRISTLPRSRRSESIEVQASHLGLGVHPAVLWVIAERLAQAEGKWRPFAHTHPVRGLFYRDPHRLSVADLYT
jgi:pimeloyl-ACP methyl ester carboxylesterase